MKEVAELKKEVLVIIGKTFKAFMKIVHVIMCWCPEYVQIC
jgi:hypothetical protein